MIIRLIQVIWCVMSRITYVIFLFVQRFQFMIVIVVTVYYGIHILLYISAIHKLFMLKIISYLRTHRNIALNTTHSLHCSGYKTKKNTICLFALFTLQHKPNQICNFVSLLLTIIQLISFKKQITENGFQ